jgi:hypothetical protein
MKKNLMFDDSILNKKIIGASRNCKPLFDLILKVTYHQYLCNRWVNRLFEKKYGGKK